MEDCWDLQAIVNGCRKGTSTSHMQDFQAPFYSPLSEDDELSSIYPEFFLNSTVLHEFEGVGIPIYPVLNPLFQHPNSPTSLKEPEKFHQKNQSKAVKQKPSKKSQQNRVVKNVREDEVCSDSWAWRKYGQKPIKGSPYPRSYYRCSSSKGCPARKQLERSHSDPLSFTVTYTAEHNHTQPTRRNALAGSTRKKFPTPGNTDDINGGGYQKLDMVLSPTTGSTASVEEEQLANDDVLINFPAADVFSGLEDLLFG